MHPEEIKAALRMRGVTQAMLADQLRVAGSSVSQAISGTIKSGRIQGYIAQIIGKSIREIWPNQTRLRRTRAEIEAARANFTH
jgi:lambda repressor-like predicted transcriptional regulator